MERRSRPPVCAFCLLRENYLTATKILQKIVNGKDVESQCHQYLKKCPTCRSYKSRHDFEDHKKRCKRGLSRRFMCGTCIDRRMEEFHFGFGFSEYHIAKCHMDNMNLSTSEESEAEIFDFSPSDATTSTADEDTSRSSITITSENESEKNAPPVVSLADEILSFGIRQATNEPKDEDCTEDEAIIPSSDEESAESEKTEGESSITHSSENYEPPSSESTESTEDSITCSIESDDLSIGRFDNQRKRRKISTTPSSSSSSDVYTPKIRRYTDNDIENQQQQQQQQIVDSVDDPPQESADSQPQENLSKYELFVRKQRAQNRLLLQSLGIFKAKDLFVQALQSHKPKAKARKRKSTENLGPSRFSERIKARRTLQEENRKNELSGNNENMEVGESVPGNNENMEVGESVPVPVEIPEPVALEPAGIFRRRVKRKRDEFGCFMREVPVEIPEPVALEPAEIFRRRVQRKRDEFGCFMQEGEQPRPRKKGRFDRNLELESIRNTLLGVQSDDPFFKGTTGRTRAKTQFRP